MTYTLQDAKAKFSELVTTCLAEGPQTVTRHGQNAVVVVPYDDYQRLVAPKLSLAEFLGSAPRVDLELTRSRERGREVTFE
jgi:prevent-host-death family protein